MSRLECRLNTIQLESVAVTHFIKFEGELELIL